MRKILGISAFYHDSAATLTIGGKIVAAAQEERFTREKHTLAFPINAIKYCLEFANLEINNLDAIVFYDKPLLKFERILETYYAFAPKGIASFLKGIPTWLNEKMFLKKVIYKNLKEIGEYDKKKIKLLFSEHHLSHAASAYYPSPYKEAAILTIDGVGEWSTASIGIGKDNKITILKELNFPHSVGLLYSAFTYFLGFKVNSGEHKLMGLAPFGNPDDKETIQFEKIIKKYLVDIKEDGSVWLDQSYYSYSIALRMVPDKKWRRLFGFPRRKAEEEIKQHHCNLALAIQRITEEIILRMANEAKRLTGSNNLCMAGGVALNCVANGKLLKAGIFKNLFIQPAASDAGGSLGAALAVSNMYFDEPRIEIALQDQMQGSYLGPEYSNQQIDLIFKKTEAIYRHYSSFDELTKMIAEKIKGGNIVGWFQGRMEFGPRSLGNRSILGDALNPAMQRKVNLIIKHREVFRPFAPSVLSDDVSLFFDLNVSSPYMLFVAYLKENYRSTVDQSFSNLKPLEKLYSERSKLQSISHVDFSARIHSVHKDINPRFWKLIDAFKQQTGYGLVLNTSFNVRGEPIVCTPYDAYKCFMNTDMNYLVINDFVFNKMEQPDWQNKSKWNIKFEMD